MQRVGRRHVVRVVQVAWAAQVSDGIRDGRRRRSELSTRTEEVTLLWLEFVVRVSGSMVLPLDPGQLVVLCADVLWFQVPALAGGYRDDLVVLLAKEFFGAVCIGRSVEHERVHGPGHLLLLLGFPATFVRSATHPSIHVLDRDIGQVLGELAQRTSEMHILAFGQGFATRALALFAGRSLLRGPGGWASTGRWRGP